MTEGIFQIASSIFCVVFIVVYIRIGRINPRIGVWVLLPISGLLATFVFYFFAYLFDTYHTDVQSFLLWGAVTRLYLILMIGGGGVIMLRESKP